MRLEEATKDRVRVSLQPDEAAHLLNGLESLRGEIGTVADDLITALRSAGVTPALEPEHYRTEWAGPQ